MTDKLWAIIYETPTFHPRHDSKNILPIFNVVWSARWRHFQPIRGRLSRYLLSRITPSPLYIFSELELPRWKGASFLFAENTFERFGYYGVRAVLLLFMRWKIIKIKISIILALHSRDMLGYDDNMSTVLYHVFVTLTYVWPLFLAILADSGLGKRNTIAIALVRI